MSDWITGMDLSTLLAVERNGGRFFDRGRQGDAMEILKEHGMNLVRLRLWNDPFDEDGCPYGAGGGDLETVLALAKRAQRLGIGWLLDFHYSDFWADPGKQRIPKAWRGMDGKRLGQAVYDYTAGVLKRCQKEAVMPQIVAVGNELSRGLLWPLGKVPEYQNIAAFVSAGIHAVREAGPVSVMLHLDNGGCNELYRCWFDQYLANGGADFDFIGLSYYPFWHGTPDMLRDNMNDLAVRYGKELIVAETSMGFTMEDYAEYEQLAPQERKGMATRPEVAARATYPLTPQGQADFMSELLEIIRQVPGGLGRGFCYWEPAWLPVPHVGWANAASCAYIEEDGPYGNEWANQALFDYDGNALPALEVIKQFSRAVQ